MENMAATWQETQHFFFSEFAKTYGTFWSATKFVWLDAWYGREGVKGSRVKASVLAVRSAIAAVVTAAITAALEEALRFLRQRLKYAAKNQ
jgi:hypothetical protein